MYDWYLYSVHISHFKCSVSCGTGIQIRKIDCIVPISSNGTNSDYLHSRNSSGAGSIGIVDGSDIGTANVMVNIYKNDGKFDRIESLSDASSNDRIILNEQISMDCDSKFKPIATQSCTTGIECTTIINGNIGSYGYEESDRITHTSNEKENEYIYENGNEYENVNANENDNTGNDSSSEELHMESVNVDITEDVERSPFEVSVENTNEEDADTSIKKDVNIENIARSGENEKIEVNFGGSFDDLFFISPFTLLYFSFILFRYII